MKKIILISGFTLGFFCVCPNINAKTYNESYSYGNNTAYANSYVDETIFGNSKRLSDGTYGSIKRIKENNYDNSYYKLDKFKYVIYKYDKVLNARVKKINEDYLYVAKNNSIVITYTSSKTEGSTYEKSMEENLKGPYSIQKGLTASLDVLKFTYFIDSELSTSISNKIKEEKSYTISEGLSIKNVLNAFDCDRYYACEIRADFDVYFVKVFEINYSQEVKNKKTWYGKKYKTYSYKASGLSDAGYFIKYAFREDSSAIGFYPYIKEGSMYKNIMDKQNGYVYLDGEI